MIPPCDPSILEHNPNFKRLYENITTNLLNADGSTRANSTDPAREAVMEDLKQCQIRSAKKRIKAQTLRQLAFASDSGLPDESHDTLAITSLYLETPCTAIEPVSSPQDREESGPQQDDALSLLAPEIEAFYSQIPSIILPFSNTLSSAIHELRALAATNADSDINPDIAAPALVGSRSIPAPTRSSSNHHARARARDRRVRTSMAPVPPLSSQLRDRVRALRRIQLSDLPAARQKMAATAAAVLAVRTLVLERTVVILERAKHGTLSRATKAKAEHLATVAQGIEGKLEVTKLEIAATLYTPETLAALGGYQKHLRDTRGRLDERRALAIEELKRYGDVDMPEGTGADRTGGDGGTLAEIARRYGVLAKEVEVIRMEIARLGE
ncbi:uncharacterized protein N7459_005329 [Penicillium hispanicum]|uniref:uncharacterized protein n=1 Tax=Penicillium hispanicum TaxID=1080232 RepID=UPI00253FC465|nr:uncharacterized protein N7459_005329 [Penicillium hispanicum]KAJ5585529.1 hypothetical protein N7459_005329 [Penicillium hispanicum]